MKKSILMLAFIAGLSLAASAQTPAPNQTQQKTKLSPDEKAVKLTQYMTTQLGLTADQQEKVSALNTLKAKQLSEIKAKYNGDMKAASPELKPIKQEYTATLKTILTPEQYTKWEQIKRKKKEELKQKHQSQEAISPEDLD